MFSNLRSDRLKQTCIKTKKTIRYLSICDSSAHDNSWWAGWSDQQMILRFWEVSRKRWEVKVCYTAIQLRDLKLKPRCTDVMYYGQLVIVDSPKCHLSPVLQRLVRQTDGLAVQLPPARANWCRHQTLPSPPLLTPLSLLCCWPSY